MKKLLYLVVLLLMPLAGWSQTAVITGTAIGIGQTLTLPVTLQVQLVGCSPDTPHIIPSGSVITNNFSVSAAPITFVATATVYGNDIVQCNNQSYTTYAVTWNVNGRPATPTATYRVVEGQTCNISNGTCKPIGFTPAQIQNSTSSICAGNTVLSGFSSNFLPICTAITGSPITSANIIAGLGFTPMAVGATAGGDLSGTYPNPTVPNAIKIGTTAGGDLGGTYPNPTVVNAIRPNPAAAQTITQPAATSLAVNSFNNIVYVQAASGTEIGSKVQAALNTFGSTCGSVVIPPGSYTWSSEVIKPVCSTIEGNGAVVTVPVMSLPALAVASVIGGPTVPATYTIGQVNDITFMGPGNTNAGSIGIYVGGSTAGVITPSTAVAFLHNFNNVHVQNFGTGVRYGVAFQIGWYGGSITLNGNGIDFANEITGLENLHFHGTQILNNTNFGILENQQGMYVEMNLFGVSIDYNGEDAVGDHRNVSFLYGFFNMFGGHIEGSTMPHVHMLFPLGAPNEVSMYFEGVTFNRGTGSIVTTIPGFIKFDASISSLTLGPHNEFYSNTAPITAVVDFQDANPSNFVRSDFYRYRTISGGTTIDAALPTVGGLTPTHYEYFVYNTSGQIGSINYRVKSYSDNLLATQAIPSIIPQGGSLSWNDFGNGATGLINNRGSGAGGWIFVDEDPSTHTRTQKASVSQTGVVQGVGGFQSGASLGTTTSFTISSCTLTVVGGIITAHSGAGCP